MRLNDLSNEVQAALIMPIYDRLDPDEAVNGDADGIVQQQLDELVAAGYGLVATNDTRAHMWKQRQELRDEVDRLNGQLARLRAVGANGRSSDG